MQVLLTAFLLFGFSVCSSMTSIREKMIEYGGDETDTSEYEEISYQSGRQSEESVGLDSAEVESVKLDFENQSSDRTSLILAAGCLALIAASCIMIWQLVL